MYAILFILSGEYMYKLSVKDGHKREFPYLFTGQETKERKNRYPEERFETAYFTSKEDAEKLFDEFFWKSSDTEGASWVSLDNKKVELTDEKNKIYFEIVEVK